jgi:hypothetical protein
VQLTSKARPLLQSRRFLFDNLQMPDSTIRSRLGKLSTETVTQVLNPFQSCRTQGAQSMFATVLEFSDFFWIWVITTIAVSGMSVYLKPKDQARMRRLEKKIDLLLEQSGLSKEKEDAPAGVLDALQRGDKIGAIKRYREATGASLAEAKEQVEAIQAREYL